MITLITGIPGMGKTSLLVTMLMEIEAKGERPVFVMGIPDLQIEHIPAPPVEQWTELRPDKDDPNLLLPYFTFPPNSVLVVDECQRVYRPRASATKVPDYVAALETHRHTGLDIILLTQKPKLIDINVRELVGRHIHIRNGLLGRHLYEWPHIADGESRNDRLEAARRRFKPPAKAFTKYKSAEAHTKHKFRVNQLLVYAAAALLFFAWAAYNAYETVRRNTAPAEQAKADSNKGAGGDALQRGPASAAAVATQKTASDVLAENRPRIEGLLHTAPRYDDLTKPTVVPQIAGCYRTAKSCKCYTQQGTPYDTTPAICSQFIDGGIFIDFQPQQAAPVLPPPPVAPQPAQDAPQGQQQATAHPAVRYSAS